MYLHHLSGDGTSSIFSHDAGTEEVLSDIITKTDGVPLFVEELTKTMLTGESAAVPATIQASLAARLDRLGPAKEVAQIGAVIGRTFTHKLIAAVSDKGSEALEEALRRLVKAELLFQRGVSPEALYTFKHALIQDAAYDSLLKIKRSTIHMRVAETLVQNSGDISAAAPELIAHHYSEAGHAEQAVEHWLDAGQRSIRRSTHLEAIAHLRSGLSQLMTLPETADRGHKELTYQINLGAAYFVAKG